MERSDSESSSVKHKGKDNHHDNWKTARFRKYCRACYQHYSTLDYEQHSEVVENPCFGSSGIDTTIIFTHRLGGSRAHFRPHARYLADKYGYRSILLDYAGHGSRDEEPCNVENCVKAVREVLEKYQLGNKDGSSGKDHTHKIIFAASSSWGARMTFQITEKLKEETTFAGVILDSCSDAVDSSSPVQQVLRRIKRRVKNRKWLLSRYAKMRIQRAWWIMRGRSFLDNAVQDNIFGAGVFFPEDKTNNVTTTTPMTKKNLVQAMSCPVLFLNGRTTTKKSRKDEQTPNNDDDNDYECNQVFFEGGDHLVAHDRRYFNSWVEMAASFVHHTSPLPPATMVAGP